MDTAAAPAQHRGSLLDGGAGGTALFCFCSSSLPPPLFVGSFLGDQGLLFPCRSPCPAPRAPLGTDGLVVCLRAFVSSRLSTRTWSESRGVGVRAAQANQRARVVIACRGGLMMGWGRVVGSRGLPASTCTRGPRASVFLFHVRPLVNHPWHGWRCPAGLAGGGGLLALGRGDAMPRQSSVDAPKPGGTRRPLRDCVYLPVVFRFWRLCRRICAPWPCHAMRCLLT